MTLKQIYRVADSTARAILSGWSNEDYQFEIWDCLFAINWDGVNDADLERLADWFGIMY